ncbi:MAG TPA: LytTR family DNA-binding domain-containing protein [Gemmatimonadaceae bacterium]
MTSIRALIVDDEPLTRERVRTLIEKTDGMEIVGEGRNGLEALDLITSLEPDLVFIDVEMPELDGFGVIRELDAEKLPAVIFITAYEQYARQAFDVGAVDYLYKPITPSRFADAVGRARDRLERKSQLDLNAILSLSEQRRTGFRKRFVVRKGNEHFFVPTNDVEWIDAADNYLRLHVSGKTHFTRGTMKQVEEELDPERFVRIHRSAIVAIDKIRSIRSHESGGHTIELSDGVQLRSSRQFASRVSGLLR